MYTIKIENEHYSEYYNWIPKELLEYVVKFSTNYLWAFFSSSCLKMCSMAHSYNTYTIL